MEDQIAAPILGKMVEFVVDKTVKQFSYLFSYNSNIENLREELTDLGNAREEVQLSVDAARRKLQGTRADAQTWMTRVDNIQNEAGKVLEGTSKVEKGFGWKGWCPNLKQRYLLSRKAAKQTEAILKLRGKSGKDRKVSYEALPPGMLFAPLTEGSYGFESRKSTMNDVLMALKNDKISKIGICGMAGVGKTILVKQIWNGVIAQKMFDEVAMAVVSRNPEVAQIQSELAEMLGLKIEGISAHARAVQLLKRLTDGSRILVILDDVGVGVPLEEVGLPVDGDHKGCKVVFTSRMEQVCTEMGAQKIVHVNVLPHEEAWDLLTKMAGECVENTDLRPIANEVLKECGGLPIAISTLGKALENKPIYAWEDALRELKNATVTSIHGMHEKVYSSIQLSYNTLKTSQPESQPLLKLCCLFPEDANIPVEKLIRYAKGLRFYPHVENLADTSNRVNTLLDYLKSCFLILPGDKEMTVKLHDVVRLVCLSIASKDERPYVVKHDPELEEWPQMYEAASISLMSQALHELPAGLKYPMLELLRLQLGGESVEIQSEFSKEMKEVRVFDFMGFSRWANHLRINALPPALEFLTNLQTLSLEFCELNSSELSLIGTLKKLEILSFFSSKLDELPSQIGELSNLRMLDLRCATVPRHPTKIPRDVLCRLKRLEDLYMGNFDSWQKENYNEQRHKRKDVSIKELSSLTHLMTLQIRVKYPALLLQLKDPWFEKLRRYQLAAVREELSFDEFEIGKTLTFEGVDWSSLVDSKISALLKSSECLTLHFSTFENLSDNIFEVCANLKTLKMSFCDKVEYIIDEQDSDAALNHLKHLDISSMDDLKEICKGNLRPESLKVLETVKLDSLPAMTHLWKGPIQPPCLGNLRVVEITDCMEVTSIFPYCIAKSLVQLQEIDICRCQSLEGVVSYEGGENGEVAETIVLRNLSSLSLDDLPNFKSFFPEVDTKGSETVEENPKQLSQERRTGYKAQGCIWLTRKKQTSEDTEHRTLINSKNSTSSSTCSLFNQQVKLPTLNKLHIRSIKNLESIVDGLTLGMLLSKLRIMHVDGCGKLLNIAASDFIKLLPCLEQVRVQNCESLEAVFDYKGIKVKEQPADSTLSKLETMSLHKLPKLAQIWKMVPGGVLGFINLKTLEIFTCGSLKYILTLSIAKTLKNLQQLRVQDCAQVEVIIESEGFSDEITFPQLCTLQLDKLDSLASFSSGNPVLESRKLQKVVIKQCPKMKTFCQGQVKAPKLKRVSQGEDDQKGIWKGDLNSTISFLHMEIEKECLLQTQ